MYQQLTLISSYWFSLLYILLPAALLISVYVQKLIIVSVKYLWITYVEIV